MAFRVRPDGQPYIYNQKDKDWLSINVLIPLFYNLIYINIVGHFFGPIFIHLQVGKMKLKTQIDYLMRSLECLAESLIIIQLN